MITRLRQRVEALEGIAIDANLRLPTFAEWYAGYMNNGDVLPTGEVIRLPRGSVSWSQFYGSGAGTVQNWAVVS